MEGPKKEKKNPDQSHLAADGWSVFGWSGLRAHSSALPHDTVPARWVAVVMGVAGAGLMSTPLGHWWNWRFNVVAVLSVNGLGVARAVIADAVGVFWPLRVKQPTRSLKRRSVRLACPSHWIEAEPGQKRHRKSYTINFYLEDSSIANLFSFQETSKAIISAEETEQQPLQAAKRR